jgi:hypothetical protein
MPPSVLKARPPEKGARVVQAGDDRPYFLFTEPNPCSRPNRCRTLVMHPLLCVAQGLEPLKPRTVMPGAGRVEGDAVLLCFPRFKPSPALLPLLCVLRHRTSSMFGVRKIGWSPRTQESRASARKL